MRTATLVPKINAPPKAIFTLCIRVRSSRISMRWNWLDRNSTLARLAETAILMNKINRCGANWLKSDVMLRPSL